MQSAVVDPRDTVWEVDQPIYRAHIWTPTPGARHEQSVATSWACTEYELHGAESVLDVISWLDEKVAESEVSTLYVLHVDGDGNKGLVRVMGTDPTEPTR